MMAFSTDETFRRAAESAAARWKPAENQTPALKEQTADTFRLTKRIQEIAGTTSIYSPVREAWKGAFKAAGCLDDFNFDDDSQI
jgi:hypothetical protein